MYGFVLGYLLVELIGIFDRAIFHTGCTTGAFILYDIPWLLANVDLEIPCLAFNVINFGEG
jgi:hypothetical protein